MKEGINISFILHTTGEEKEWEIAGKIRRAVVGKLYVVNFEQGGKNNNIVI